MAFSFQRSAHGSQRDAVQKLPQSECKMAVLPQLSACNFFVFSGTK
jgi:hypothetical protein